MTGFVAVQEVSMRRRVRTPAGEKGGSGGSSHKERSSRFRGVTKHRRSGRSALPPQTPPPPPHLLASSNVRRAQHIAHWQQNAVK